MGIGCRRLCRPRRAPQWRHAACPPRRRASGAKPRLQHAVLRPYFAARSHQTAGCAHLARPSDRGALPRVQPLCRHVHSGINQRAARTGGDGCDGCGRSLARSMARSALHRRGQPAHPLLRLHRVWRLGRDAIPLDHRGAERDGLPRLRQSRFPAARKP